MTTPHDKSSTSESSGNVTSKIDYDEACRLVLRDRPGNRIQPDVKDEDGDRILQSQPDPPPWRKLRDMALPRFVPLRGFLTKQQSECTHEPCIPRAMEDKWVSYRHANRIRVHRSWTGYLMFEIAVVPSIHKGYEGGEEIICAWATRAIGPFAEWSDQKLAIQCAMEIRKFILPSVTKLVNMDRFNSLPHERYDELAREYGKVTDEIHDREFKRYRNELAEYWSSSPERDDINYWVGDKDFYMEFFNAYRSK